MAGGFPASPIDRTWYFHWGGPRFSPWLGRSSGEGNSYPHQYSGLENQYKDQFSCSVMSNSLQPHGMQHARPPCPSPTPRVYSNSCSLSRWWHPTISSSVIPFSSCPNLSQHQGLFKWANSSHQVARVLEFQLQHQSFQWTLRTDLL